MKIPLLLLFATLIASATTRADVLFEANFASRSPGRIRLGETLVDRKGVASFWEGPQENSNGYFATMDPPEATGGNPGKSVLAIYDHNAEANQAPTFSVQLSKVPESAKTEVIETKLLVPVSGPYLGLIGLGKGGWDAAAAILVLSDGKVRMWQSGDAYSTVGSYTPNAWLTLRVTLDLVNKTYDVEVDGQKVATALAWVHPKSPAPAYVEVVSDLCARDRGEDPVLYIEHFRITLE